MICPTCPLPFDNMKKNLTSLFVATAVWLMGNLSAFGYNGIPWYQDPCHTEITNNVCSGGSISFTNLVINDCGLPISASVETTNKCGTNIFTSIWIAASTNCPGSTNISTVCPNVLSNGWVANGPGSFSASGDGLSASFSPTNIGSGSITFYEAYQNGCTTNVQKVTCGGSYNISCPTITNCTQQPSTYSISQGAYGAVIGYNFQCAGGWYSWETNAVTSTCGNFPLVNAPDADHYDWSQGDQIYTPNPSGGSCTMTAQQIIYFALVGGGGNTNNNSVCSFANTQSITITQTNAPNTPPHGTIVTSVTIGGGFSVTNYY